MYRVEPGLGTMSRLQTLPPWRDLNTRPLRRRRVLYNHYTKRALPINPNHENTFVVLNGIRRVHCEQQRFTRQVVYQHY